MVQFTDLSSNHTDPPAISTSELLSFDFALHYLNAKLTPPALAQLDRSISQNSVNKPPPYRHWVKICNLPQLQSTPSFASLARSLISFIVDFKSKSFQNPRLGNSHRYFTTNYSESFHCQLRSLRTRNLPLGYFYIILSKFLDHFSVLYENPGIGYYYGSSFLCSNRIKRSLPHPKSNPLNRVLYPSELEIGEE